ncbi:MAG: M48 family metalloprotease [bacterium]
MKKNHITKSILLSVILKYGLPLLVLSALAQKIINGTKIPLISYESSDFKTVFLSPAQNLLLRFFSGGLLGTDLDYDKSKHKFLNSFVFVFPGVLALLLYLYYRSDEKEADLSAAAIADNSGQQGLKKLYEIVHDKHKLLYYYMRFKELPILNLLSTHPTLEQRLKYLDEFDKKNKSELQTL